MTYLRSSFRCSQNVMSGLSAPVWQAAKAAPKAVVSSDCKARAWPKRWRALSWKQQTNTQAMTSNTAILLPHFQESARNRRLAVWLSGSLSNINFVWQGSQQFARLASLMAFVKPHQRGMRKTESQDSE